MQLVMVSLLMLRTSSMILGSRPSRIAVSCSLVVVVVWVFVNPHCGTVFIGFNQNEASERAEMIEMYGGTVINNVEDEPTHLVCAKGGTAKVR